MKAEFPKMLYRAGGAEEIHGGRFTTRIVATAAELDDALHDGWYLTTTNAKEAAELPPPPVSDNAPATRAELEQKAIALGIKFDGRTSDKKLGDLIDATLEA